LEKNNLSREKIRITNCVRCRPPNNRDPHKSEIENCNTHLNKEIDAVNPKVIIPLGRVPSETLIGKIDKITNMTGEKYTYQSKSCEAEILISVHPAATIYNRSLKPDFNSVFEKVTDIIK